MINITVLLAIIFYLVATYRLGKRILITDEREKQRNKYQALTAGFIAILLHSIVLYQNIYTNIGLNLGFYNALSLMSWCISLIVIIVALVKPLENLAIIFLPLTALCIVLEILFPSSRILSESAPSGLRIHVLLSVCAYSLLTIAALQALVLAVQDHQISTKHPQRIMQLPPMQIMEDLLIQLIAIGFFMLSLSLITGMMFLHDIFAQHLVHKTVLSVLAWFIFGTLLWGHWKQGWRGKKAFRWTIGGFFLLMLAYFGSKLVLELVLNRI